MAHYARIEDGSVVAVLEIDDGLKVGKDLFTEEFAASLKSCAESVSAGWTFDGNKSKPPSAPTEDLEALKNDLCQAIDVAAEFQRLRFITAGEGQSLTYQRKIEEAKSAVEESEPEESSYPLLSASLGIDGETIHEVAATIIEMDRQWSVVGAAIERMRLMTKKQIRSAADVEGARAAVNAATWP